MPVVTVRTAFVTSRAEIRREMETRDDFENWYLHVGRNWDRVILGNMPAEPYARYNGQSVAATARDIYSAPALLGFSLLVALWLTDARLSATRFDKLALRWTRWLVTLIACGFALFPATLALAYAVWLRNDRARRPL